MSAINNASPVMIEKGREENPLIILCDHATNRVPEPYEALGLPSSAFERHIAYDIGTLALSKLLAARLGAVLISSNFSRLLIDPNRGEDDPTLIMKLSDGAIIPGNRHVDQEETKRRIEHYYRPYHDAIYNTIENFLAKDQVPVVVSMHSFTDQWKGTKRPWHVGVLWDCDDRLPIPLIKALEGQGDIRVGDNEPYDGALGNDTMFKHCTARGLAHALIEVRQDLISNEAGIHQWAERLAEALSPCLEMQNLYEKRFFISRTGLPVE